MRLQTRDMTRGNAAKHIFFFALPLMFGNILQQMYTMVDSIVVGRAIGVKALAAIGASDWLNWTVLGTVIGFCQGFSILISQYFGAEDYDKLRKSVAMSVIAGAIVALAATVIFLPSTRMLLVLLNTPEDILKDSLQYLRIIFAGIIVIAAYNILSSILRAIGNSKTPLRAMTVASIINIFLDILFVVVFQWGVAGAAIATVIAQIFSCIICFRAIRSISVLKMSRKDWELDKSLLVKLFKLGAPMAFQNTIIGIGGIVVQYVINGFGIIFVAGFTAVMKLYGLLELAATSFGFSMATFTGQNLGAKKYTRIREGMNSALKMAISTALVISAVILVFGQKIVRLFISGGKNEVDAVVNVAYNYLLIMGALLFILYMLYIYRSALQGMGDTIIPMISGIVELIMRIGSVLILPIFFGQYGVYFAEVIAWIGAEVLLMVTYYYRMNRLLKENQEPEEIPA
jgi:putative MATE family efflux protein